jgi:bifunctional non-homologous end joining protein LigD
MARLETYRRKRDFSQTGEPRGTGRAAAAGHAFVVQKHDATRLHYDFRLELDGTLKSWAVTKGPSLVPADKRLAVEVEDHPLDYQSFEGVIPKGQYGGGSVIVWDHGTWEPQGDPHKGLAKGHLDVELHGEKLKGLWHLVRMRRKRGEKRNNWLLIKSKDEAARTPDEPDILEQEPASVVTGRTVEEVAEQEGEGAPPPAAARRAARKSRAAATADGVDYATIKDARNAELPDFVAPALATLEAKPPAGRRWVHEIKFDGYRLQARLDRGKVKLLTRTGLDWTKKFGAAVPDAFKGLHVTDALIDGELVVEGESGASDFSALTDDLSEGRTDRFVYYAFDLLHADGIDLRKAPLSERKAALKALLAELGTDGLVRFSEHFATDGDVMLAHACRLGLEGIVSKLAADAYRSGRVRSWIKSKCAARQEFVIAGMVPSTAVKNAVGSLVLGYYEDGEFIYAGRVGTGFSVKAARDLWVRLTALKQARSPFAQKLSAAEMRHVQWARPQLVAEIEFRGWTGTHVLRHAAFHGLREDKPAGDIVREDTAAPPAPNGRARKASPVTLTHPDRIYWPDAGVTKQGLADYYADVWQWMAPFVVARPLSLLRCPGGIADQCFFQKAAWKGINGAIHEVDNHGAGGDKVLVIDGLDGMIALVQGGVLEVHPWGATVADLDRPDRLIFDLDPGEGVGWEALKVAAEEVRARLADAKLTSFLKTTGGKGLHVVVPLASAVGWDEAKVFSRAIAEAMARDSPALYVANMAKAKRGGRVFVDYLRNGRGSTAVAAYSSRARAGAPVSLPLTWNELGADLRGDAFNVTNAMNRLSQLKADPWAGFFKLRQRLPTKGK